MRNEDDAQIANSRANSERAGDPLALTSAPLCASCPSETARSDFLLVLIDIAERGLSLRSAIVRARGEFARADADERSTNRELGKDRLIGDVCR